MVGLPSSSHHYARTQQEGVGITCGRRLLVCVCESERRSFSLFSYCNRSDKGIFESESMERVSGSDAPRPQLPVMRKSPCWHRPHTRPSIRSLPVSCPCMCADCSAVGPVIADDCTRAYPCVCVGLPFYSRPSNRLALTRTE